MFFSSILIVVIFCVCTNLFIHCKKNSRVNLLLWQGVQEVLYERRVTDLLLEEFLSYGVQKEPHMVLLPFYLLDFAVECSLACA